MLASTWVLLLAPATAPAKDDQEQLQGCWNCQMLPSRTALMAITRHNPMFQFWLRIEGDELTVVSAARIDFMSAPRPRLRLLPDEDPKQVEIRYDGKPVARAIYERRDDRVVVAFGTKPNVPPERFADVGKHGGTQLLLQRVPAAEVERLLPLQGAWKKIQGDWPGKDLEPGFLIVVGQVAFWHGQRTRALGSFRLAADENSRKADLHHVPGIFRKTPPPVPAIWKLEDDRVTICASLGDERPVDFEPDEGEAKFVLERMPRAEVLEAFAERALPQALKAGGTYLAPRKQALRRFLERFPGTEAAARVQRELDKMPSDEEIAEIDARKFFALAEKSLADDSPVDARTQFQLLIERYPDTKAAAAARPKLKALTESEAARELRNTRAVLARSPQRAKPRLKNIVARYPGTAAAGEAARLLKDID